MDVVTEGTELVEGAEEVAEVTVGAGGDAIRRMSSTQIKVAVSASVTRQTESTLLALLFNLPP